MAPSENRQRTALEITQDWFGNTADPQPQHGLPEQLTEHSNEFLYEAHGVPLPDGLTTYTVEEFDEAMWQVVDHDMDEECRSLTPNDILDSAKDLIASGLAKDDGRPEMVAFDQGGYERTMARDQVLENFDWRIQADQNPQLVQDAVAETYRGVLQAAYGGEAFHDDMHYTELETIASGSSYCPSFGEVNKELSRLTGGLKVVRSPNDIQKEDQLRQPHEPRRASRDRQSLESVDRGQVQRLQHGQEPPGSFGPELS